MVLTWMGDRLVPMLTGIAPLGTGILWPWLLLVLGWLTLSHLQGRLRRTRALTLGLVTLSLGLLATRGTGRPASTLSLESVDIGQGDALLLRVPGGDATLVDTGPGPWTGRRMARVLSRRGVREPVHLVLTHAHGDHAGGWATLARLWPITSTSVPVTAEEEDPWTPFRPSAGVDPAGLLRGDTWTRGEAVFNVRWPIRAFALPDANMVSAVLRVTWRDRELWLMGDALAIQERDLLDLGDPGPSPHRLLKAGHHGSRNASDPAWVAALKPEVVIIPAGFRNRFEHPHPETLDTFRRAGLTPWITGPSGGIRVSVEEAGWRVDTGDGASAFTPLRTSPKP
jgi:competence protein ComEC